MDGVTAVGLAGAIHEADKAGKRMKVLYDFPWTTVAGIQGEEVLTLGHYSISPSIAVIASPGTRAIISCSTGCKRTCTTYTISPNQQVSTES